MSFNPAKLKFSKEIWRQKLRLSAFHIYSGLIFTGKQYAGVEYSKLTMLQFSRLTYSNFRRCTEIVVVIRISGYNIIYIT